MLNYLTGQYATMDESIAIDYTGESNSHTCKKLFKILIIRVHVYMLAISIHTLIICA